MIRPYLPIDKPQLLEIFKLNTPKYFDPLEINDFEQYREQKSDTYLVVKSDNEIVGGTGYYVNESDQSGRITWLFFDPKCAGQGLGRRSVEHCLELLRKENEVNKFIVTTSQLAYKIIEKFGYHITRTEKDYWDKGIDLYEMEMSNL